MQTTIAPGLANDPQAVAAERILRRCVHCGFCLATCPTYDLLGDELDSPRGRIYLIKQVVEGHQPTACTQLHLDRCLTCRNCETTCPSGVEYGQLLDLGRSMVEQQVGRKWSQKLIRKLLLLTLPYSGRLRPLVRVAQGLRGVLPASFAHSIPLQQTPGSWPSNEQARVMLVLDGCAQSVMTPATNAATARVLQALGVELQRMKDTGCCGAVSFHLNEQEDAKAFMRRNIDAWWPAIEAGAEAIVTTASGCGVMVKDYGHLLSDDTRYASKAQRVSELAVDIVEVLKKEDLSRITANARQMGKVAFHPPCTLQHGQKLPLHTETLLTQLGFELVPVADSHSCCGSAGTYSLLQPSLSRQLRDKKVSALTAQQPDIIATANIGCQLHIQTGTGLAGNDIRVVHWIELIDQLLSTSSPS
ncbi:MAG: glycolate oxidase subunit GlcF [Granulosicoccus sp.]